MQEKHAAIGAIWNRSALPFTGAQKSPCGPLVKNLVGEFNQVLGIVTEAGAIKFRGDVDQAIGEREPAGRATFRQFCEAGV
jgi:hypothetical protein